MISTTEVPHLVVQSATDPAVVGGGTGGAVLVWTGDGVFPVSSFFWPHLSIVGYAFLGTYVFTLFHVLRGYQRRDLHPKSYNTIVVRILAAYALALVVGVFTTDGQIAEVTLFFVGFMPESALVWLREKISATTGPAQYIPLREPAPLTDLEGIDLYDRTRLAEEGINNVEGLAHADIVELMSSTRISAAQLVDWTDQAILYLRVGGDMAAKRDDAGGGSGGGGRGGAPSVVPDVYANLAHLRSYGIRTASDLIQVYGQAWRRGGTDDVARKAEVDALRAALELRPDAATTKVYSIQTIIDTLPDEEWFVQISNWRTTEFGAVDSWYFYLDGHDWEPQHPPDYPPRVQRALEELPSVPMASTPSRPSRRTVRAGHRLNGDGQLSGTVDHLSVANGGQQDEPGAGDAPPGDGPVDGEGQASFLDAGTEYPAVRRALLATDEAAPARYGRTGRATLAGWETGDLPAGC